MHPFPEAHELISFFSQEPELAHADTPPFYNTLRFSGRVGEVAYVIRISPSDRELRLQTQSDQMSVDLAVTDVAGLTVHEGPTESLMMATFSPDSRRGLLKFRLHPRLEIEWPFEKH